MRYFYIRNKGFISAYFFIIFLVMIMIITIVSNNLHYRTMTLDNLQSVIHQSQQELRIVSEIRNMLINENLEDSEYEVLNDKIFVQFENHELVITLDSNQKYIEDYEVISMK